jgi:condensin complex subunit 3
MGMCIWNLRETCLRNWLRRALQVRCLSFPSFLSNLFTNEIIGEEKKSLAPLLSKLHVSPASTHSLLRETYELISASIEDKSLIQSLDATGRNSLYKIHVSLGKIVNTLKEKEDEAGDMRASVNTFRGSVASSGSGSGRKTSPVEDKTLMTIENDDDQEEDDEGTVVGDSGRRGGRDSLVEELLSDEDVEMSGI